jgi:DNA-directed RNA polymerase specialized sigma24 family protein
MNRRWGDSHPAVRSTAVRKDCGPQDEMRALARQVADWPTTQRRVFTLRKVYGLRPGEIAHRLGLTNAEVETHLIAAALAVSGLDPPQIHRSPNDPDRQSTFAF